MKKLKKFLAVMISMIMVLSMATVGFATTGKQGSVEIGLSGTDKSASGNHIVKMYQILNLDSYEGTKYSYSVNTKYSEVVKSVLQDLQVTVNDNTDIIAEILKLKDSDKLQTFANKFEETVSRRDDLAPEGTGTIDSSSENKSTTVGNLNMGYYLIVLDNAKQIQANLVTIKDIGNNKIELKAETPSITKKADVNDVEIGQIVTYTITTTIPKQLSETMVYRITDTLTEGLDFVNFNEPNAIVTQDNLEIDAKLKDKNTENYTPITEIKASVKGRTMTINLAQYIKDNQAKIGQEIRIQYKAKVNEKAVIKTNNSATLVYGKEEQNTIVNKPEQVKTPTFPVHINKVDDKQAALGGVKFELYTDNGGQKGTAINVSNSKDGIYKVQPKSGITEMVTVGSDITNAEFGKTNGFNLVINGLKAGTYWLQETQALDGYNKIKEPIKITVTNNDNGQYTISTDQKDGITAVDNIVTIVNKTSSALPETGGTGTLLLTAVGALLVAVAMIRFMRRKQEN